MNEELKIFITAQIDDLKKNLKEAQSETKKTAKDGESNFKKFGNAAKAAGKLIASAMKAAIAAIAAAATALVAVAESTREYRTEQAKLTTAFEAAGSSAEQAKTTYNDLFRVLGDSAQATEAAQSLSLLTTNEQELAEWTKICQGAYAEMGDKLPIESLAEAANETAKTGQITGGLADALNWAGVSEEEFQKKLNACNTEAEREKLMRETLIGIYGESAELYEENAKDILDANDAQRKLTEGMAALGAAVEPVLTIFKSLAGDALISIAPQFKEISQAIQDVVNGVDGAGDKLADAIGALIDNVIGAAVDLIPKFLKIGVDMCNAIWTGLMEAIPVLLQAVVDVLPSIITTILEQLPVLTGGILSMLPSLIDTILKLVNEILVILPGILTEIILQVVACIPMLIEALMTNLPLLIQGIIQLVSAIVAALPTIILAIVDILPDLISSILAGVIACVPQILAGLFQLVATLVAAIPGILISLVKAVVNVFVGLYEAIIEIFTNIGPWFGEAFTEAWENICEAFSGVGTFFTGVWSSIVKILTPVGEWFGSIFSKAWEGIKKAFSAVSSFFSGVWNDIKSIFSKVGTSIAEGIKGAVSNAVNSVLSKAVSIINGFISAINAAISVLNALPGVGISKLKKLSVPKMAKGGIVDSATLAVIGEQGKEAVVPLENNTEWLDKLASRLSGAMGGQGPIILQVDGKTFGEISCDSINQLTRQRGQLAINMW